MTSIRTRAEQETIIRWDEESDLADFYTASPSVAKRWQRWGIELRPMPGGGWRGAVPKDRIARKKISLQKTRRKGNPRWIAATTTADSDPKSGEASSVC